MDLAQRNQLWLLMLLPLLLALAGRSARRREAEWMLLGQGGRLRGDGTLAWLAAIGCLVIALAQPRWGRVPAPPLPPGRDVVFLVDDSRSMAAQDAVPDRLGVAVDAASSLIRALARRQGNRVAVVAFAGRGVLRCPLTENLGAATDALHNLRPGDVRPGGTNLGAGLMAALDAFGDREQEPEQAGGRTVVLLSDGEDHAGSAASAALRLREAGVVVHAIAVGDAENGHPIPSPRGEGPLAYDGAPVLSRRTDAPLATIAETTGGAVVPLGLAAADLGDLYLNRIEPVARQKRLVFRSSERAERYGWFVLAALGVGLIGSWPRYRARQPRAGRLLPWAGLLALVGLVAGAAGDQAETKGAVTAAQAVELGRKAYTAGQWADALKAFEQAASLEPKAAVPLYDAAATLYQLERFSEALEAYATARQTATAGSALRTKIDYALGNTALALGDAHAAIGHYDACLASRTRGSDLDAVRRDAAVNRRFAVESAQRSPAPPSDGGSSAAPRSRPPRSDKQGQGAPDGSKPGPANGSDGARQGPQERRGSGGAGGSGPAPADGGSAEDQLDSAVERVREARQHRPPEAAPPTPSATNQKDW